MFLNGVIIVLYCLLKMSDRDFPGDPVAKTPCYKSRGSIPDQRTKHPMPQLKIPMAAIKNSQTATKDSVCTEKSDDCSKKKGKEEGREERKGKKGEGERKEVYQPRYVELKKKFTSLHGERK